MDNLGQELIDEALKVYKIKPEHVFASKYHPETGEAVIVTAGGAKVRYRKGDKAKTDLSYTDITGELPPKEMVWDKKLNQRRPKDAK